MVSGLRLLHVSPFVVPDPALGGVPQSVLNLCEALHRRGHSITIWASNTGDPSFWRRGPSRENDFSIRLYKGYWPSLSARLNTPILPELFFPDLHALRNFDVVHIHGYWNAFNPSVGLACRKSAIPLVLQPHGMLVDSGEKGLAKAIFQLLFRKSVVESTSAALALSETERDQLSRNGFTDSQIRIIPNIAPPPPLNLPLPQSAKQRLGLPEGAKIILYLGRLHRPKGVMELLAAFRLVQKSIPESMLMYVGQDEGMLSELKRTTREAGIRGVAFLGPFDSDRRWLALRAANLLCLPSSFEGFPRVVLEAGVAGTPTIISKRIELPYAASEGALVQCDPEPQALSECIASILASESLQRDLSKRIRAWVVNHFTANEIIPLVEDLYMHVIRTTRDNRSIRGRKRGE